MNKETQNIISKIINDVYEKNLNRRFWVNSLREILEENFREKTILNKKSILTIIENYKAFDYTPIKAMVEDLKKLLD